MDKEKLQELETLLNGLEFDLTEISDKLRSVRVGIDDIREALQDKKEEF